jgi:hypothetical protein
VLEQYATGLGVPVHRGQEVTGLVDDGSVVHLKL